ncbi:MAG: SCO family protein [Acidobacteria bacterium]|nr:SCO family protein [Acidobacteriota bacterium]
MRHTWQSLAAPALRRPGLTALAIVTAIAGAGLAGYSTADFSGVTEASLGIHPTMAPEAPDAGDPPLARGDSPVRDFVLTDEEGRRVSLGQQAGKVTLVNFVTSRCTDACPRVTRQLRNLQATLGDRMERDVMFLSIGLDPRVDSRGAIRKFAVDLGVEFNGWRFLTGSPAELERARSAFDVQVLNAPPGGDASVDLVHTASVFLVDRTGVLRRKLDPDTLPQSALDAVEAALAGRPAT